MNELLLSNFYDILSNHLANGTEIVRKFQNKPKPKDPRKKSVANLLCSYWVNTNESEGQDSYIGSTENGLLYEHTYQGERNVSLEVICEGEGAMDALDLFSTKLRTQNSRDFCLTKLLSYNDTTTSINQIPSGIGGFQVERAVAIFSFTFTTTYSEDLQIIEEAPIGSNFEQ